MGEKMRNRVLLVAVLSVGLSPVVSLATSTFTDPLVSSSSSTNYNVNVGQDGATTNDGSSDATFGYNYANVGVPLDPFFAGNTTATALRIRAALTSTNFGGISVAPNQTVTGFALPTNASGAFTPFQVQYDMYTNFVKNGDNSTTLEDVGINDGKTAVSIFNPGTMTFGSTIDGGTTNTDYRAYVNNTDQLISNSINANWYGAYSVAHGTTDTINDNLYSATSIATAKTVAYYENALTGGGSVPVPTAQGTSGDGEQAGSSTSGTTSYQWHVVDLSFDGTNYTWSIDGSIMAQVPASGVTSAFAGTDFFIGGADTGSSGTTNADGQLYNFILVDNLVVTAVPEPASISLLGLGAMSLLARRRK
jgi:PEP-CTERM motif